MEKRSEQEVRGIVRDLILELAPNPAAAEEFSDPHLLDQLEFNSLALLEVAFTLEDEFELEPIDRETAERIHTINDIAGHVVDELRKRGDLLEDYAAVDGS
jgi:acyl carrier protein